ncbi:MAG: VWA domain-containing protein [Hyphomicrobiales bacterium]|nr:VWA domain-containing protein [Hyphomicrobiales bacterium]
MMTFALATIPMIGFVGAAVDYSRGNSAKAAMQAALDSTALMLSKDAQTLTTAQLAQKATNIFMVQFNRPDATDVLVTPTFSTPSTSSFKLVIAATGKVPTTFTKVLGQSYMNLNVSSEVVWGVKKLELALALDVTGSMASNNKMTELKKAAKSLLTTLKNAAKKDGDIKVAIVPFSVDVNVGTNNVNANWLNWTDWEGPPANSMPGPNVGPGSACPWTNGTNGFRCQSGPANGSSITSTIPSSGAYSGYICPTAKSNKYHNGCYNSVPTTTTTTNTICTGWGCNCNGYSNCSCTGHGHSKQCTQTVTTTGAPYAHTWISNARSTWNGCVTDRDQDYDVNNTAPSTSIMATQFVPHQQVDCPAAPLMPLSTDWNALTAKIDSLQPQGNTNVTIGLAWGFHALTAAGPLNNAAVASAGLDKVIILLTDGDNTQNRWSTTQSSIDARTQLACASVKAANIKLYTIRVINGNASLLQGCATKPDMYYDVQNASQLNNVFTTIAQSLANLRIAK